jgi:hypothetical protein
MSFFGKKIYIDDCLGLCNRLETLVLARAIRRSFGHEIVLGWPELDVLRIEGTCRGNPGLWGRCGAVRMRSCSPELFQGLAARQRIILRGFGGPEEQMAAVYEEAASGLGLCTPFAEGVAAALRNIGPRPLVGVHLRRGDFPLFSEEIYNLHQTPLSAVPLWWHEWVMRAIVRRQPRACFLVCHNGAADAVAKLRQQFEVLEMPVSNPYKRQKGHQSPRHPVADLFALACCPVILATPVSSFSHYAANVLGAASTCLLPPPQMNRAAPAVVRVRVHRRLLRHWVEACLGPNAEVLRPTLEGIDFDQTAQAHWLQTPQSVS